MGDKISVWDRVLLAKAGLICCWGRNTGTRDVDTHCVLLGCSSCVSPRLKEGGAMVAIVWSFTFFGEGVLVGIGVIINGLGVRLSGESPHWISVCFTLSSSTSSSRAAASSILALSSDSSWWFLATSALYRLFNLSTSSCAVASLICSELISVFALSNWCSNVEAAMELVSAVKGSCPLEVLPAGGVWGLETVDVTSAL